MSETVDPNEVDVDVDVDVPEDEEGEKYDGGEIPGTGTPAPDTRPPEEREDDD